MRQDRLFRLAVEALGFNAHHEPGRGWRLAVVVRRGDEHWDDAHKELYEALSTPELADVIAEELARALGL